MFKKWFKFGKKDEEENQENVLEETEEQQADPLEDSEQEQQESLEAAEDFEETVIEDFVQETEIKQEDEPIPGEDLPEEPEEVHWPPESEEEQEETEEEHKKSFFKKLFTGLDKTRKNIVDRIDQAINNYGEIDESLFEEIEEILITADVGMETTMKLVEDLREELVVQKVKDTQGVHRALAAVMERLMTTEDQNKLEDRTPTLFLVIGVNGAGKTTSIGKMAWQFKRENKKVLLAAGDTFRAAAIDQLKVWADRTNTPIIAHQEGSDPAAVVFDGIQAAKSRNVDVLICDTAGRLHNKKNLMNELEKIFRVIDREWPEVNKEVLLVLDATTGQNAVQQARLFKEVAHISGIILTKLDGTAKGGVVLAIQSELGIPVKLVGVGEGVRDLQPFVPADFVHALMNLPQEN